jgi:hypothetical protein
MSKFINVLKKGAKKAWHLATDPCVYHFYLDEDDFTNLIKGKEIVMRKATSEYAFGITFKNVSHDTMIRIIKDNFRD